ncbi:hypothetical protein IJJ97_06460 [bacterium]|nr:hypothetical protein [bacterium]
MIYDMEVLIENNPVIRKVWNDWFEKDRELSGMTKEERLDYCKDFQWVYPKETKGFVDLESIYSSVHHKSNREEFKRWFYVVCGYMLSRVHLGDNSYYQYKKIFKKLFRREKCTSVDFPKQVILVLAMMGYITELGSWYVFNQGCDYNRGYHFIIDREKLVYWDSLDDKEWKMTHTEGVTFQEDGSDPERTSWTLHPDWLSERQYESILSVTVEKEGIRESSDWMFRLDDFIDYYDLGDKEKEETDSQWISYQRLRDLSLHKIGGCLDDSVRDDGRQPYAGRFYSLMTIIKKEDRHHYLRLDGELVTEVDISSAQPTFLGILMYQMTGVKSEWLRQCLGGDGDFYMWIREKTNTQEPREQVKKWMMQFLYSCYQPNRGKDYDKPHKPTYEFRKTDDPFLCFQQRLFKFLKKEEPGIYKVIDWFKRHPEYRKDKPLYETYLDDKGKDRKKKVGTGRFCSNLSYYLVRMEVDYIQRCIHTLPGDMKFWTIHDCICVKESDSLRVKEIMEQVSREMYGENITLRLKRENTSEDYS